METTPSPLANVLRYGDWRDWLPQLPRPALALGPARLFQVAVRGYGFSLSVAGHPDPFDEFQTSLIVSALNVPEAETKACHRIASKWQQGFGRTSGPSLDLEIVAVWRLKQRLAVRTGTAFLIYAAPADE